jgi:FMN phosphatase YigB (HAD superfamily)
MEGYEPGKAVFVDDLEENIIGAINVGITAVQFINAASLRLEFDRLGLFR